MTPEQLVARFRSDVDDDQQPYLWSTDEVWEYLNDAHRMHVRLTGGIRDASTASVVNLTVSIGDPWLELSPLVMKIRSARLASTGRTLPVFSFEGLFGQQGVANREFPCSTDDLDKSGPLKALIIGMEDDKLRAVRIPAAGDTVKLVVERLPLLTLTADLSEPFEIRAEYHLHLLWWMKHLAYAKQDADTFDKERSDNCETTFRARCSEAADEKRRREHKPRLMAYGGL